MNTTANLRKENLLEILKVIRSQKRVTRPEIAKKTKLTGVTVSTLIAELMSRNLVVEEGLTDSRGGRKAVAYKLNETLYYIIGVYINPDVLTIDIYDLNGNRAASGLSTSAHRGQTVENTISLIIKGVQQVIEGADKEKRDIIGIGVLVPGRVDFAKGIVHYLPNISNWIDIPLKTILERELGITTLVERDTNSQILYLKMKGLTDHVNSVVYCSITEGVGASVQVDGKVFHGDHGLAGEVGHTIVMPDGPECSCGNRGCVESLSSTRAIIGCYERALEQMGRALEDVMGAGASELPEDEKINRLLELAAEGDAAADQAFQTSVKYLGICIHNIINTYDPGHIIVECRWMKKARKYFNQLVSGVFDSHNIMNRSDVKIVLNPVDDICSVAAYAIVIEWLMSDPMKNILINNSANV
jgi:N-acetylglucosamine repressor